MKTSVDLTIVEKQLNKLPYYILDKLYRWVDQINEFGIDRVRKISGYHDEPLKGNRKGQRSIRLNKAYRAIYIESSKDNLAILKVIEVNKHEY